MPHQRSPELHVSRVSGVLTVSELRELFGHFGRVLAVQFLRSAEAGAFVVRLAQ